MKTIIEKRYKLLTIVYTFLSNIKDGEIINTELIDSIEVSGDRYIDMIDKKVYADKLSQNDIFIYMGKKLIVLNII